MKNISCLLIATLTLKSLFAVETPTPNRYEPLPIGSITAEGWLGLQLEQMTEGLVGRLQEHSRFLAPDNGWLSRTGSLGWEEQSYWLRSYAKLAILTRNQKMLKETERWMEGMAANADADGWYGPHVLKAATNGVGRIVSDVWPHMVMNEAILTWWDYTGDKRWLDFVHRFLLWCQAQDDVRLIPSFDDLAYVPAYEPATYGTGNWTWSIQICRAADMLPAIYRVYDATHDAELLKLAQRIYAKRSRAGLFLDKHNVNFSQLFAYSTVYGRQSKNPGDLAAADHWYDLMMAAWGAMIPRQGFAGDEVVRLGCYDPRYGTETCTWAELIRSYSLLAAQTGATKWADRAEDVAFNWCPISYTHGWKELHYITAANQVNLDAQHDHNYANYPPQVAFSSRIYRCCRHNAALALPEFTQHLVMRDQDGLIFWTYAPHSGKALINGRTVSWKMSTHYPFDGKINVRVQGARGLKIRYRVPSWAEADAGRVREYPVSNADELTFTLSFDSQPKFHHEVRTGAVMVEKGPLTYSVALEPSIRRIKCPKYNWTDQGMKTEYAENMEPVTFDDELVEIVPVAGSRWNFALETSCQPEFRERSWTDDCFTYASAPCELFVMGRELKEWTLQDAQPAALQDSPAYTASPLEKIRFIPMCCARSHVTVFPTATTNSFVGTHWKLVPEKTLRKNRAPHLQNL